MTAARPHPPSSQRIAQARASGHAPHAPLVGFGCGLLAVFATGFWLAPRVERTFGELLRAPLELAARGRSAEAHARALALLGGLTSFVVGALVLVSVVIALGCFAAQGPAFARLTGSLSTRLPTLRPSRTAGALWCLGLVVLWLVTLSEWTRFSQSSLGSVAYEVLQGLTVLTLACMVIDVAFARARFYASLWLTRREHIAEQRDAFGAPEIRAARQLARQAARADA
ncbi:MAG: hypothetical protein JWN48_2458 [Myxococcaceae bacterium]|nr:hypothetical protein [Myxococcaceae bacterium]